jgi:2-C-methyl-D-erythritol 4-phosphate cytidylyltransferase/2-C-methyl-D-erythritol 2,4-cyclodiphosphate synthase
MQHIALVPAAGFGQRFGSAIPKQYSLLAGKTMLVHTVTALLSFTPFSRVVVVVSPNDTLAAQVLTHLLLAHPERLNISLLGGDTRAQTVLNGLSQLGADYAPNEATVWVHDAARPAIAFAQLSDLAQALIVNPTGAILAVPVADTLKRVQENGTSQRIHATVDRSHLWQAQTPQCFELHALIEALNHAAKAGIAVTDEASAMEAMGQNPTIVAGSSHNFKVTTPADAVLMEQVLGAQRSAQQNLQHPQLPRIAIGEGMDVHALVPGRPLILGGVTIPHHSGLLGHSDADALLHAITDALLGAAGMGDIGRLFPDTDAAYAGADSQVLLQRAYAQVAAAGWQVSNVDATIVAQAPKMAAHIPAMQANIARCLDIDTNQVNVKAKTNERLGWLGREEGIETRAVLMLQRV